MTNKPLKVILDASTMFNLVFVSAENSYIPPLLQNLSRMLCTSLRNKDKSLWYWKNSTMRNFRRRNTAHFFQNVFAYCSHKKYPKPTRSKKGIGLFIKSQCFENDAFLHFKGKKQPLLYRAFSKVSFLDRFRMDDNQQRINN